MVTIPTAYADPLPNALPALAKMDISTCSLMLNGPGFKENVLDPNPGMVNLVLGNIAAKKWPTGSTATWTVIWVMTRGSVL